MQKIYYFAYGSNMHPARLRQRVPSSRSCGMAHVDGYRLLFQKQGNDGSGKCNLIVTGDHSDRIFGVYYEMHTAEKPELDRIEGPPYRIVELDLRTSQGALQAFGYIAPPEAMQADLMPYDWYKNFVVSGAQLHKLPADYVSALQGVPAVPDPDVARGALNHVLLNGGER